MVEDHELGEIMRAEIRKLPDREKLVLSLYYDEGLTLAEIGQVLGVTESRVSQIHTKSVLHLRSRLLGRRRRLTPAVASSRPNCDSTSAHRARMHLDRVRSYRVEGRCRERREWCRWRACSRH